MEKQLHQNIEPSKFKDFESLYQKILAHPGAFIDYNITYPKCEFLEFLTNEKDLLLHGSDIVGNHALEPKQAHDHVRVSGNMSAVYAIQDPIIPIFYAILDHEKLFGTKTSGYDETYDEKGYENRIYEFKIEEESHTKKPYFCDGAIYIFSKDYFKQVTNNDGVLINEFVSDSPVTPIARLHVTPIDFPYLDKIVITKKAC